jgi:hypothetical protein
VNFPATLLAAAALWGDADEASDHPLRLNNRRITGKLASTDGSPQLQTGDGVQRGSPLMRPAPKRKTPTAGPTRDRRTLREFAFPNYGDSRDSSRPIFRILPDHVGVGRAPAYGTRDPRMWRDCLSAAGQRARAQMRSLARRLQEGWGGAAGCHLAPFAIVACARAVLPEGWPSG